MAIEGGEIPDHFSADDVMAEGQTSDAIQRDLADLARSAPNHVEADSEAVQNALRSQLILRNAGFEVLQRLGELHVEDATALSTELGAINPRETPFLADMSAVAFKFSEDHTRTDPDDLAERQRLVRLGSIADAVAAIAHARALYTVGVASPDAILEYADKKVDEARTVVPQTTHDALVTLLQETRVYIDLGKQ